MSDTKKRKSDTKKSWNIKGISPDTRAKVTKAAKKSGMTIGAYIDRVLSEAATNDLKRKKDLPVNIEDVQTQLASMNEAITKLTQKLDQPKRRSWNIFKRD